MIYSHLPKGDRSVLAKWGLTKGRYATFTSRAVATKPGAPVVDLATAVRKGCTEGISRDTFYTSSGKSLCFYRGWVLQFYWVRLSSESESKVVTVSM